MSSDPAAARASLQTDRHATEERRRQLHADLAAIVEAATDVATDDEHDPEGATIAYERARTAALLAQAHDHLSEIDAALARVDAGDYGRCQRCGASIARERLEARRTARTCIDCAS